MGSRYKNNHMHPQHLHPRTTFLPMLCSRTSSVKDVHRRRPPNPSSSSSSHPTSPIVTCMGQVNRSNRVTGYPTPPAAASPIKYHKLIRLFSGKNAAAITTATGRSAEKIIVARSLSERRMGYRDPSDQNTYAAVNVAELDPPLPVVKRRQQPAAAAADGNLWKRRSGGCELEGLQLQLQPIRLPNKRCVLQPVSTV